MDTNEIHKISTSIAGDERRYILVIAIGPRTGVHLCLCHVVISKLETPQAS